jgi:hypothetical protein
MSNVLFAYTRTAKCNESLQKLYLRYIIESHFLNFHGNGNLLFLFLFVNINKGWVLRHFNLKLKVFFSHFPWVIEHAVVPGVDTESYESG